MSPEKQGKSREEGVANAAGKDEQPEPRKYKWFAFFFMSVAIVSIFANAGQAVTIAMITKTFGTQTQKHAYAVSLTSAGESAVAKVPCVEVAEAIVSRQNGDADQGLVMIPLGNGEFSTPSMSATHYQVHENSFSMEQIFLSGNHDVSYNVSCDTSMAACDAHPGLLCDVLPSAPATASSPGALAFEDAFDGDVRRRLLDPLDFQHKDAETCKNYGCNRHCSLESDSCDSCLAACQSFFSASYCLREVCLQATVDCAW